MQKGFPVSYEKRVYKSKVYTDFEAEDVSNAISYLALFNRPLQFYVSEFREICSIIHRIKVIK